MKAPKIDEIEISIFGGNSGIGESLLIHLPFTGKWIIVDSCFGVTQDIPAPISYLHKLNTDLSKVIYVIATHWHTDHIDGLSACLKNCPNAKFGFSEALSGEQFLRYIGFDSLNKGKFHSKTAMEEFNDCLESSKSEDREIVKIKADQLLYNEEGVTVHSLAPSNQIVKKYDEKIGGFLKKYITPDKNPIGGYYENEASIVLLVSTKQKEVLLGADLEKNEWSVLLDNSHAVKESRVSLYKVPHHGSEGAWSEKVWNGKLLKEKNYTILTPYSRGKKKLPQKNMVNAFFSHSFKGYTTGSPSGFSKKKKRGIEQKKIIRKTGFSNRLKELSGFSGHIRLRSDAIKGNSKDQVKGKKGKWEVALFGISKEIGRIAMK